MQHRATASQEARRSQQRREHLTHAASTPVRCRRPSVALGALHAALDPVERLYTRRRIDTFGGEVLDVDQIDPLEVGIILGAADRDWLDRLMAVAKFHL